MRQKTLQEIALLLLYQLWILLSRVGKIPTLKSRLKCRREGEKSGGFLQDFLVRLIEQ